MRTATLMLSSRFAAFSAFVAAMSFAAAATASDWTLSEQTPIPSSTSDWDIGFTAPDLNGGALDAALGLDLRPTTRGLFSERSQEVRFVGASGAVDQLRLTSNGRLIQPNGAPLLIARPGGDMMFADEAVDLTYTRGWPSAFSVTSGRYALDVTPHAGVGFGDYGGSAEAGAMVRLGEAAQRLGIRDGGEFGDVGRWYLYAAASGRAVGYNFQRRDEGWARSGLSTDEGAFIGDAQIGVAWRRGAVQTSFGYIRREVKSDWGVRGAGVGDQDDSVVAFSLSIKPRAR